MALLWRNTNDIADRLDGRKINFRCEDGVMKTPRTKEKEGEYLNGDRISGELLLLFKDDLQLNENSRL